MDRNETKRIIDGLLEDARQGYEIRQEALQAFEGLLNLELDDPGLIDDKDTALSVCRIFVCLSIEHGGMAEGSVMHRLALRLMDYINRL